MQRFTRIKLQDNGRKVHVAFERRPAAGGAEWDTYSVTSSDLPRPGFREALARLVAEVVAICELPEDYGRGMEVSGVSLSYGGEEEIMGATITARKTLETAASPLILNTPHLPSAPYSEGGDAPLLPASAVDAIELLIAEASAYLDGDRAQGHLFAGDGVRIDEQFAEGARRVLAEDPAFVSDLAKIAPGPGSSIESVTISATRADGEPLGDPVTLTAEDGARLRKKAAALRQGARGARP